MLVEGEKEKLPTKEISFQNSIVHEQTVTSNIQIQSKYYSVLKFYYHQ